MTATIDIENQYGFDVYPKRDVVIVRGENAKVWDENGREFIDCVAGHGAVNVGHCNPQVIDAIAEQASKLISCTGIFYSDVRAQLLKKLVEIAPSNLERAFLCNSGAESIEAALKFARLTTQKTDFVCAMRGFHGRTMGALSATFNPNYKNDFQPLVPGFSFAPFNRFDRLEAMVSERTAGVVLEVVQGEGGVNIGDADYFKKVQTLCNQMGILLIIDEVQTGFCRTGKMFAVDHFTVQPDIMCIAKSIAGGVPMGAVLCSRIVTAPVGKHGSTFGGNPLSCAAAIAAINFMVDNNLAEQARQKGNYFVEKLSQQDFRCVREIRHLGLMIGIELKEKVKPFLLHLMEEGVLALPAGSTVLRLLPPLTISYAELDTVLTTLTKILK